VRRKALIDYLDKLWSQLTKLIHGAFCAWCGSTYQLESDHIVPRRFFQTRWRIEVAVILCFTCHRVRKLNDPDGWEAMVNRVRGVDTWEALKKQSLRTDRVDLNEVRKYLEDLDPENQEAVFGRKA
jgi:5-methylcytosine-specific restriction endonuclease McrA